MANDFLDVAAPRVRHTSLPTGIGAIVRTCFHHFVIRFVSPIARHPAMTVLTGVGLLLSGMMEVFEQIFTDFESLVGPREGVILLGIVTFFKGLADLVEASEWLSKGVEEEREQEKSAHH